MKGLVIAGTSSHIGKTTIALAIMNAIDEDIQPYKVGPDYIDPSHHEEITGNNSRNLDIHLMGEEGVKRNYMLGKGEFGIIEGVMGLYDSYEESTAKVAKILGLPVILVLDASNGMESVAAIALGFKEFDNVKIKGVILNNISSEKQDKIIKKCLKKSNITCLGSIFNDEELKIPSRHLGLYMGKEKKINQSKLDELEENLDIKKIKEIAKEPKIEPNMNREKDVEKKNISIGIAYDSAFNFYYTYNIDTMKKNCNLKFFSPIEDELPKADAYYFGGGYPELHLDSLESNNKLKKQLEDQASRGKPIFAECGGFMYLAQSIKKDKSQYNMAGILPLNIEMTDSLQAIGYTKVESIKDLPIAEKGTKLKGHEFHYSKAYPDRDAQEAFSLKRGKGIDGEHDGLIEYSTIGCYNHFHECQFRYLHKLIENSSQP